MPALLSRRTILFFIFFIAFLFTAGIFVQVSAEDSVLTNSWHLSAQSGAVEDYQRVDPQILQGKSAIAITYNMHGTCLLPGDASAIVFDQNGWKYISLARYGQNCKDGEQTVSIPLSDFKDIANGTPLNISMPLTGYFHIRFWNNKPYLVDITNVSLIANSSPTPTVTTVQSPISTTTPTPTVSILPILIQPTTQTSNLGTWQIQSIDAMKDTKDAICGKRSSTWITQWVQKAKELGANYVAISTPYENPSCGDSIAYAKLWVNIIRSQGLHVWHRHMPLAFEGIYSVAKNKADFLPLIQKYIASNPDLFAPGDIFTPIPEPQNGGIQGVTYCASSICQFTGAADFNVWLRNAMTVSANAFSSIGIKNIKIGYFGFDGFTAWGDNNPDWHGILEDATIKQMGNITIDHYPELVHETMDQGLTELQSRYPNIPIVIGEWGTVTGGNTVQQIQDDMGAAKKHGVVGFNYWQFGPEGSGEQLIDNNFNNLPGFAAVQSFYK